MRKNWVRRARARRTDSRVLRSISVMMVLLVLVVSGCSAIPTTGPIGTIPARGLGSTQAPVIDAQGPRDGASPEEIVRGFIDAGANVGDDFVTARKFLSSSMAPHWKPNTKTTLYASDFKVSVAGSPDHQEVQFQLAGTIDGSGVFSDTGSGSSQALDVQLTQEDDQWRISHVDDGLIIGEKLASNVFKREYIYFYNSTFDRMVPDERWFLDQPSIIGASMVQAMLSGPAPYLRGAVASAFPDGARMSQNAVPIASGQALVDVPRNVIDSAWPIDVQRMILQLQYTLQGLSNVTSVRLSASGSDVSPKPVDGFIAPTLGLQVGQSAVAVDGNGQIVKLVGTSVSEQPEFSELSRLGVRSPAMSYDGKSLAFLNRDATKLYGVTTQDTYFAAIDSTALTDPSFDQLTVPGARLQNWVWSVGSDHSPAAAGSGAVVNAVRVDDVPSQPVKVSAPWLQNQTVTDFRVARDGARALVVVSDKTGSTIYLTGIVRDAKGVPIRLNTPIDIAERANPVKARWSGQTSYVLLDMVPGKAPTPESVEMNEDKPDLLPSLSQAQSLTAGNTPTEILISTKNTVLTQAGRNWVEYAKGISQAAYPG